jgi:hypothetical protein
MRSPDPENYGPTMTAGELAAILLQNPDWLVYMSVPTELNMCFNIRSVQPDKLTDGEKETPVLLLCFEEESTSQDKENVDARKR